MAGFYFAVSQDPDGAETCIWDVKTFLENEYHTIKEQDDLKALVWTMRGLWPSAIEKVFVEVRGDKVVVGAYVKPERLETCVDKRRKR